jgi:hypothetical protein
MKKLIALLLITIFVGSSFVNLYIDFAESTFASISLFEADDDETEKEIEKEIEKETDLKKDKIILNIVNFSLPDLSVTQKFYIKHLYFLPSPTLSKDIIPPNVA